MHQNLALAVDDECLDVRLPVVDDALTDLTQADQGLDDADHRWVLCDGRIENRHGHHDSPFVDRLQIHVPADVDGPGGATLEHALDREVELRNRLDAQ